MAEILKKFGLKVKKLREAKNLTQENLAELADLHRTYISSLERGQRNVSLENIEKIAKAFKVSTKELF